MLSTIQKFIEATKQLLPNGRAFRIPSGSVKEQVETGILESHVSAHDSAVEILDKILPDNDNFLAEDATRWEQRLGLIDGTGVPLDDRKLAIRRKMNHPGDILARQSRDYIEQQLQDAGFDVYVFENIPVSTPASVIVAAIPELGEMGEPEMGEIEMGSAYSYYPSLFVAPEMGEPEMGTMQMAGYQYNQLIVNHINEANDAWYQIGDYRTTFFICDDPVGTFADVPIERKNEFRQLVLRLKPVQSQAILFINYV